MVVIRVLARVLWLPIKLALEIVGLAFRAGRTAGRAPVRVGVAATRRLGWRRIALLKVGFIAGLLLAPVPGRVLRAKLVGLVRPSAAPDAGLADRVSFELSHAPRTWHLPQPAVTVDEAAGVTLRGTVPHEDAREHLVAAARRARRRPRPRRPRRRGARRLGRGRHRRRHRRGRRLGVLSPFGARTLAR
ncbi:MAG: hypothetical protein R2699_10015 [Acidimicrobiales bacterium]